MVLKVAITGNIASGKSEAEKLLAKNYPVYDTDKMAHEILDTLTEFEGYDVFTDGHINRKKLGEIVFSNQDAKNKLEKIIHPQVKAKIEEVFENHKNDEIVFISVPLLYETGFETLFDKVLLITIDDDTRLERLIKRDNCTRENALKRINSQMSQDEKAERADFIISNNSDLEYLNNQVLVFIGELHRFIHFKDD